MNHSSANRHDLGLLLARVMLGVVFAFHGAQKLFGWFGGYGLEATGQWMESIGIPFGTFSAFAAGSTELFGGVALALGLFTLPVGFALMGTMLVAAFSAHSGFGGAEGFEYPLTLAVVSAALALTGPGRFALSLSGSRQPATATA